MLPEHTQGSRSRRSSYEFDAQSITIGDDSSPLDASDKACWSHHTAPCSATRDVYLDQGVVSES
jgi:hypothetical protein